MEYRGSYLNLLQPQRTGYQQPLCRDNARAPVAQLVRVSDQHPEDPGSNPG